MPTSDVYLTKQRKWEGTCFPLHLGLQLEQRQNVSIQDGRQARSAGYGTITVARRSLLVYCKEGSSWRRCHVDHVKGMSCVAHNCGMTHVLAGGQQRSAAANVLFAVARRLRADAAAVGELSSGAPCSFIC